MGQQVRALYGASLSPDATAFAHLIDDGGYLPMLDHSATPDTPYENYQYFLEQLNGIL